MEGSRSESDIPPHATRKWTRVVDSGILSQSNQAVVIANHRRVVQQVDLVWEFANLRLVSPLGPDRVHVEVRQGNDLNRTVCQQ